MPKRTIQISVWSDDDAKVAAFINGIDLMADAAFERHTMIFSGPGTKKVNAARLDGDKWRSGNVSGRMKLKD